MRGRQAIFALALVLAVSCGGAAGSRIEVPQVEGEIELLAPAEEGAGSIPTFEWEAARGASEYRLAVLNATGEVIWSWQGAATTVVLGDVPDRPENETGPIIREGSRWSVIAMNAEGKVVAVSSFRQVSP